MIAAFRQTFQSVYGVKYDQNAIANYYMHPTKANYQKAFGTKNDIGYRVDKYNQSQQQAAGYVKTAVKVGVGINDCSNCNLQAVHHLLRRRHNGSQQAAYFANGWILP